MNEHIHMSLAFNWEKPPNLLYAFQRVGNSKPLLIEGRSLSSGKFLIDPPLFSESALLSFSLYEWGVDTIKGNAQESHSHKPRCLKIISGNFEFDSMFNSAPTFNEFQVSERVDPTDSPFPGLSSLLRWSSATDMDRVFQVHELSEAQIFEVSATVIVTPHPEDSATTRKVRTFHFDPELVVGTDETPDPDDPASGPA